MPKTGPSTNPNFGPKQAGEYVQEVGQPKLSIAIAVIMAAMALLKKYQERAQTAGTDPLGYYMPVWADAYLQVLGDAIAATQSLNDDDVLADYMHKNAFKTLAAQFQYIKGNSVDDFRDPSTTETIVYPPQFKSGEVIYPYVNALEQ